MTYTILGDTRTGDERLQDLLLAIDTAELPIERRTVARALLLDGVRPTITWHAPRPGRHTIDGQVLDSDLVGLMAAHLAFMSPARRVVRASDMAGPGAAHPANAARNALRVAARFLGPLNMRAAAAVRLVRVVGGFVVYAPDGRFDVVATI